MAQSDAEMAKDMVVALLGQTKEIFHGDLEDRATELGKAIAKVYKEVYGGIKSSYQK